MKTYISLSDRQKIHTISKEIKDIIKKSCRATLKFENFSYDAEISITLVDNTEIRTLNSDYRNIDKETDVLSFPLGENGEYDLNPSTNAFCLGDIIISTEKAFEQAKLYGHGAEREFAFLTVHSMLHLLGYDHVNNKQEEKIMFEKQEEILKTMGLSVEKK